MSIEEQLTTTSECEQELIDVIGVQATLLLEERFRSSYLYISAKRASDDIIDAVGEEPAQKLVDHFGCGDIWIPRMLLLKKRDIEIAQGSGSGKTIKELAAKFELSSKRIKCILKERLEYAKQPNNP